MTTQEKLTARGWQCLSPSAGIWHKGRHFIQTLESKLEYWKSIPSPVTTIETPTSSPILEDYTRDPRYAEICGHYAANGGQDPYRNILPTSPEGFNHVMGYHYAIITISREEWTRMDNAFGDYSDVIIIML